MPSYAHNIDTLIEEDTCTICEEFDHLHERELGMIFPIEYMEEEHLYED